MGGVGCLKIYIEKVILVLLVAYYKQDQSVILEIKDFWNTTVQKKTIKCGYTLLNDNMKISFFFGNVANKFSSHVA